MAPPGMAHGSVAYGALASDGAYPQPPSASVLPQNNAASVSPTLACMAWLVEGMIAFHYGGIRPPALLCFVPSSIKSSSVATAAEREAARSRRRLSSFYGMASIFIGFLKLHSEQASDGRP